MRNLANFHQKTRKCQHWDFEGIFLSEVENVWAKKLQRMCNGTEEWRGIDLPFHNWRKEVDKVWLEHSKVSKMWTLMGYFWPKYVMLKLKSTEDLYLMVLNIDTTFEGKLTCALKNNMKNLANFHQSTWKSQNWDFHEILLSKVENVWTVKCM